MILILYYIVVLELAGERLERVMSTNEIIGEPGAIYYGMVNNNRRYMNIEAAPIAEEEVEQEQQEDDDSGIEVDLPHGVDEVDGHQSRLSQNTDEPSSPVTLETAYSGIRDFQNTTIRMIYARYPRANN